MPNIVTISDIADHITALETAVATLQMQVLDLQNAPAGGEPIHDAHVLAEKAATALAVAIILKAGTIQDDAALLAFYNTVKAGI